MKIKTVEQLAKEYRKTTPNQMYGDELGFIAGYDSAQKQIKHKLLDKLNHLRSDYQQQTQGKLGRVSNFKKETELLSKIELLKELLK